MPERECLAKANDNEKKDEKLIGVGVMFEKVMIDKAKLLGTLELPSNRMRREEYLRSVVN
ncbi:MAG: hypothetical protein IK079_06015 [Desulfovibrio sp.]|nr:hypothetical protein [Desulfovibrio sp.]